MPPEKKQGSGKLLLIIGGVVVAFGCCCVTPGGIGGLGWYLGWFAGKDTKVVQGGNKEGAKEKVAGGGIPTIPAVGNVIDKLLASDPKIDYGPLAGGAKPTKQFKVKLEGGKKYVFTMKADVRSNPLKYDPRNVHDPFVRLLDAQGNQVAADDDGLDPGKSLDARMRFAPPQTAEYTIQATHLLPLPAAGMGFDLDIRTE